MSLNGTCVVAENLCECLESLSALELASRPLSEQSVTAS